MTTLYLVPDDDTVARAALLRSLMAELFQAEKSAELHCEREARRHRAHTFPMTQGRLPSASLWTLSRQARASLAILHQLAAARGFKLAPKARGLGVVFSQVRELVVDRLWSSERSWRATLLGLRHGVDVALSLRMVAEAAGDDAVAIFCDGLLRARVPLVAEVENSLWWFAEHPRLALEAALG